MGVLFPTDFSELSLGAFQFALEYAYKMDCEILVFHAYDEENTISKEIQQLYNDVNIKNYKAEKIPFAPIKNLVVGKYKNVKIKYIVKKGKFIDTVTEYVTKKEDKIEIIIMGTDDKKRFLDIFVESKTLKVIEKVNKPVIAVPENTLFDGKLDHLLFLVDYKETETEPLVDLIEKVKEFDAKLHVLHLDVAHGESIVPMMDKFKETLEEQSFSNVDFVTIDALDFRTSLRKYCKENHIDMICVINHERNFYQRLFTQSLAEDLIKNVKKPIMAIYHKCITIS